MPKQLFNEFLKDHNMVDVFKFLTNNNETKGLAPEKYISDGLDWESIKKSKNEHYWEKLDLKWKITYENFKRGIKPYYHPLYLLKDFLIENNCYHEFCERSGIKKDDDFKRFIKFHMDKETPPKDIFFRGAINFTLSEEKYDKWMKILQEWIGLIV